MTKFRLKMDLHTVWKYCVQASEKFDTREYGKPCGSKIESTKRTIIMPKNLRVLAINVRVSLYRYVFLQRRCM